MTFTFAPSIWTFHGLFVGKISQPATVVPGPNVAPGTPPASLPTLTPPVGGGVVPPPPSSPPEGCVVGEPESSAPEAGDLGLLLHATGDVSVAAAARRIERMRIATESSSARVARPLSTTRGKFHVHTRRVRRARRGTGAGAHREALVRHAGGARERGAR